MSDFDINKRQLYTITTDNGRNLIKAVELLNTNSDSESDSEEGNEFEDVVSEINFDNILSIKCAAHTLQLAVKDFFVIMWPTLIRHVKWLKYIILNTSAKI